MECGAVSLHEARHAAGSRALVCGDTLSHILDQQGTGSSPNRIRKVGHEVMYKISECTVDPILGASLDVSKEEMSGETLFGL